MQSNPKVTISPEEEHTLYMKEIEIKYLFDLVKITASILDTQNPDQSKRYKHMISVSVFGKIFSATIRSGSEGIYTFNDKEIY